MTTKLYLAIRNAKGHMRSYALDAIPQDAPQAVREAAAKLTASKVQTPAATALSADPGKRGRGRPKGYVMSEQSKAAIAASQRASWAARKTH